MSGRTWRQALRWHLHRCLSCNRRGVLVMTLTPENDGVPVGASVDHRLCAKHGREVMAALLPVAETVGVELDDGSRIDARPTPTEEAR